MKVRATQPTKFIQLKRKKSPTKAKANLKTEKKILGLHQSNKLKIKNKLNRCVAKQKQTRASSRENVNFVFTGWQPTLFLNNRPTSRTITKTFLSAPRLLTAAGTSTTTIIKPTIIVKEKEYVETKRVQKVIEEEEEQDHKHSLKSRAKHEVNFSSPKSSFQTRGTNVMQRSNDKRMPIAEQVNDKFQRILHVTEQVFDVMVKHERQLRKFTLLKTLSEERKKKVIITTLEHFIDENKNLVERTGRICLCTVCRILMSWSRLARKITEDDEQEEEKEKSAKKSDDETKDIWWALENHDQKEMDVQKQNEIDEEEEARVRYFNKFILKDNELFFRKFVLDHEWTQAFVDEVKTDFRRCLEEPRGKVRSNEAFTKIMGVSESVLWK
jgi:hypothetical protein